MIKHETQALTTTRHHPVPKGSTSCKSHATDAGQTIGENEKEEQPRDPRKRVRPLIKDPCPAACSDILMDPEI